MKNKHLQDIKPQDEDINFYEEYYEIENGDLDDLIFNSFFEHKYHSEK